MSKGILLTMLAIGILAGLGGRADEAVFMSQEITGSAFTTTVFSATPAVSLTPAK